MNSVLSRVLRKAGISTPVNIKVNVKIIKKTGIYQFKYAHCVISKKVLLLLVVYGTIIMHNFGKSLASMAR